MANALVSTAFIAVVLFQAPRRDFKITDRAFGKTFVSVFTAEMVAATPTWDEEADNPPVSARAALTAAKIMRDSVAEAPEGFVWSRGSLTLIRPSEHCYWFVRFVAKKEGDDGKHSLTVIVLMDGKAIKPVVDPTE